MIFIRVDFIDEHDSDVFKVHSIPRIGEGVTFHSARNQKEYIVSDVTHYLDADGGVEVPVVVSVRGVNPRI